MYRSQPEGAARTHDRQRADGRRAEHARLAPHTAHRPRAAVPVQRPDLQRASHPLRHALRHRRGGLPRPGRARPAAGPAGAGAAPQAGTDRSRHRVRLPPGPPGLRRRRHRSHRPPPRRTTWSWPSAPSRQARPSPRPRRSLRHDQRRKTTMTDTDLDGLRARTRALCAQFPDEYWRETDREPPLPPGVRRHAHRRRAARRPHPHRVRRPRAQPHPGLSDHGGDQQVGRALRRLPRPDVHHGRGAATRQRPAEERVPAADRQGRAAPAGLLHHRTRRRLRHHQHHHHRRARRRRLRDHRPQELDQPHPGVRPGPRAGPHQPQDREPHPRADPVPGRPAPDPRRAARRRSRWCPCARCSTTPPTRCTTTGCAYRPTASSARSTAGSATSSTAGTPNASCSPPKPSATATGSSSAPSTTPPSGRSSAARSAPTRASSSPWPTPT